MSKREREEGKGRELKERLKKKMKRYICEMIEGMEEEGIGEFAGGMMRYCEALMKFDEHIRRANAENETMREDLEIAIERMSRGNRGMKERIKVKRFCPSE